MVRWIIRVICFGLALAVGSVWLQMVLAPPGEGEVSAIIDGPIMLLFGAVALVFWACGALTYAKQWKLVLGIVLAGPVLGFFAQSAGRMVLDARAATDLATRQALSADAIERLRNVETEDGWYAVSQAYVDGYPRNDREHRQRILKVNQQFWSQWRLYGAVFLDGVDDSLTSDQLWPADCAAFGVHFYEQFDSATHGSTIEKYCGDKDLPSRW